MEVHRLNHHQWKIVFNAVRKAQKALDYDLELHRRIC